MQIGRTGLGAARLQPVHVGAAAGGTAAKLLLATGIAGALLFTVSLLSLMKRSEREHAPQKAPERLQKVPYDDASSASTAITASAAPPAAAAADAYPPQPYSEKEPGSHRPYSRPYEIPRQSDGKAATNGNGSGPRGSNGLPPAGIPTTPWQPPEE